jgi:hypothetical protein
LRRSRLSWFSHLKRKDDGDLVKVCQVAVGRGRGGDKETWRECVAEDMRVEERDVHDMLK